MAIEIKSLAHDEYPIAEYKKNMKVTVCLLQTNIPHSCVHSCFFVALLRSATSCGHLPNARTAFRDSGFTALVVRCEYSLF